MENKEIFVDIVGFDGKYQISNIGNVKSVGRYVARKGQSDLYVKERIKKCSIKNSGYKTLILYRDNIGKNKTIHRLVASAFIPNPENKKEVNHKDGNKLNNCVENLEWCTPSENQYHSHKTGLNISPNGEDSVNAKIKEIDVIEIRRQYVKGDVNFSLRAIAKRFNLHPSTIYNIIKFKKWKHI